MSLYKIFIISTILIYPFYSTAQIEIGYGSSIRPVLPEPVNSLSAPLDAQNIIPPAQTMTESSAVECEIGLDDDRSVGYQCAKGVINNVIDTVMLPINILKAASLGQQKIDECNQDPEIKRGLLLIIEPLLRQGLEHWMDLDCGRLMEVARLQEAQFTKDVLRKKQLQEQLEDMIAKSPQPLSDTEQENFRTSRLRVSLTAEENLFWQRKTIRDLALAKLSDPASIERVWDAAKKKWTCLTVKETLVGLCDAITTVVGGGVTSIVARKVGKEIKRTLIGDALETIDPADGLKAARQGLSAERLEYQRNIETYGMEVVDGKIKVINPNANSIATTIARLQTKYGVTVISNNNGSARLLLGTNPESGKSFLNIAPNFFDNPQKTMSELKSLEDKLIFQQRTGIFSDSSVYPPRLILSEGKSNTAKTLKEVQSEYNFVFVPSTRNTPDLATLPSLRINRADGTIEIHPDLLKPGMEGRLRTEIETALRPQLDVGLRARDNLISAHSAKVGANGKISVTDPKSNVGKMIAALSRKGVEVNISETNFEKMQLAGGFARDDNYIAIQAQYFLPGREKDLLSILNHEITHNTSDRRLNIQNPTNLTVSTQNIYVGRNIWMKANGDVKFEGVHPLYQTEFRNDELEARLRELPIDQKLALGSGPKLRMVPTPSGSPNKDQIAARGRIPFDNNATRKEAIAFADNQMDYIRRALNFSNANVEPYNDGKMVVFAVKTPGGTVSINVPIIGSNISTADALFRAKAILKQRLITVEAQRRRLRGM